MLGGLVLIAVVLLVCIPERTASSLAPEMKLHQFGLVSEDGVIETDKIEKVDKAALELEQDRLRRKKESEREVLERENAKSEARSRRRLDRQRKAKQRKKELGAKNGRRKAKVGNVELVGYNAVRAEDRRNVAVVADDNSDDGSGDAATSGFGTKVDDFIQNGEQDSDLAGMSDRVKQVFLRKVATRKLQTEGQA